MTSIRPLALAVIRRGDDLLVFEGHDRTKNETFYRPLGGGIEFGERAVDALRRELREELAAELAGIALLGVLENLFTAFGRPGHEIVFLYAADLLDPTLYERDHVGHVLDDGSPVTWQPLRRFTGQNGTAPLYPHGLADLLARRPQTPACQA
jgi:ADP-ribose pyrophosphatase YjhB (NUDIX family)